MAEMKKAKDKKEQTVKDNSKKNNDEEKIKPEEKKQSEKKQERKITEIKERNIPIQEEEEFHGEKSFGRVIAPVLERKEVPRQSLEDQVQGDVKKKDEKDRDGKQKQDVYSAANIYNKQIYDTMNKYTGEKEIFDNIKDTTKQLFEGVKMFDTKSKFQKNLIKSQETMRPQELVEEPKYDFQRIEAKTARVPGTKHEREKITSEEKVKKYRVQGI